MSPIIVQFLLFFVVSSGISVYLVFNFFCAAKNKFWRMIAILSGIPFLLFFGKAQNDIIVVVGFCLLILGFCAQVCARKNLFGGRKKEKKIKFQPRLEEGEDLL